MGISKFRCRVAEISIDKDEDVDLNGIQNLESKYDYIVVKIASNNAKAYRDIATLDYYFVENQISLLKKSTDFVIENGLVENIYNMIKVEQVQTKPELELVLNKMTPNMFKTDRIYLDSEFGPEYTLRRYKNWTRQNLKETLMFLEFFIMKGNCFLYSSSF